LFQLREAHRPPLEEYNERVDKGEDRKKVMDKLGLDRYCCRAMFLGQVDLSEEAAMFKKF